MSSESTRAVARWTTRLIPVVLAACVGFATFVVVKRICADYFLDIKGQQATATALLALYFVLLLFMLLTYVRLVTAIVRNPGVIPLGQAGVEARKRRKSKKKREVGDIEAQRYEHGPDNDPDSPGLEQFYSKNAYICESDGRPRYCSTCKVWKPDRTYHSSEIGRCVRKMDHYCPWAGGIISQTSFKYFLQFTFYTMLYCALCITASALCLKDQIGSNQGLDGTVLGVIALAGFFGFFTFGMTAVSLRYVLINQTNVEVLRQRSIVHLFAVRVPYGTPPGATYGIIVYPLPKPDEELHQPEAPLSSRDRLAKRTFAIVKTEIGENPWNLGVWKNWVSVMGSNPVDWFLPFRQSPCVTQENNESFYEMGLAYQALRERYGLPQLAKEDGGGIEMGNVHGNGGLGGSSRHGPSTRRIT